MSRINHKHQKDSIQSHGSSNLSEKVIARSEKVTQASNQSFVYLRITFAPQGKNKQPIRHHNISFPSTAPERGR